MAVRDISDVPFRILIVDDFEPWRRHLRATLATQPECQIVGEAADGHQAVRKCEELKPDLVLLDINIPGINGIKAATRIFDVAPKAKILFLSAARDPATIRASLNAGAQGYILKANVASDLIPAIGGIRHGNCLFRAGVDKPAIFSAHAVHFYRDDETLCDNLSEFLHAAFSEFASAIVIATKAHHAALNKRLQTQGIDPHIAAIGDRYTALDASEMLGRFMDNRRPNLDGFESIMGPLLRHAKAASGNPEGRVAVFGEMVGLLWDDRNFEAAIQLERSWNDLATSHHLDLLCAYPAGSFQALDMRGPYSDLCALHSTVISA
jgi:DNA-binding NarL/FixJ family response regulator